MLSTLKTPAKKLLKQFGFSMTTHSRLQQLEHKSKLVDDLKVLAELPNHHLPQLLKLIGHSRSQLGQDLFVLSEMALKENGFFVEFGATNGVDSSNTCLLEKEFGWNGILAEPARRWHTALRSNRTCNIDTACVWRESNSVLVFNEADFAELSTIDSYSSSDYHAHARQRGKRYEVATISLGDLLDRHNAPREIDYLSIDTEGTEYEILKAFDFNRYRFGIITCEHNFTPQREQLFSLLTSNGYVRRLETISGVDDWYVSAR